MKFLILSLLLCLITVFVFAQQSKKTRLKPDYPFYAGKDLGVNYSAQNTIFKIWAPNASEVQLKLYSTGDGAEAFTTLSMKNTGKAVWETAVNKDIKNIYYSFQVKKDGKWLAEKPDIYAKAVGVNGKRGMVADMAATNPPGWQTDKRPALKDFTDIILYETHIRDLSISKNSGIKNKGKYLGFTESGTTNKSGQTTGLDHLKELGITHVHLLPFFDFNSIDESNPGDSYNWGYDPLNYNVPEGSYATNPYDGNVRIKEFKQMVQALHSNGLRVIMDVVYNHTADTQSGFTAFAPGYFYRFKADGSYSDASGCGNETASEKAMMQKFMIESVVYWVNEYHIDGFRFDLMGAHDIETMNMISDTLHKIDPTIFIYGEGWTAGSSPLAEDLRAVKKNTFKLHKIAAFGDELRDGLRGPYNDEKVKGFASGKAGLKESVMFGIVASTQHLQISYKDVNYSKAPWAAEPYQAINYVSCHDDHTLFDRLKAANPGLTEDALIKMDRLCQTVVFTSQGVPFLHSGAEMLRTKQGVGNSYKSPDSINEIDWSRKTKYIDVFEYYRSLISLRKNHPAFRMPSTKMIQEYLKFIEEDDSLFIAYHIGNHANGDAWKDILVLINGNLSDKKTDLPPGNWTLVADGKTIDDKGIGQLHGNTISVPATTVYILYQQ